MKRKWTKRMWVFAYVIILMLFLMIGVGGSHTVSIMAFNTLIENRTCIIIDAGHGGEDGGATSCTGVLEKTINLEISIRLQNLFHLLGIKTKMTRTDDSAINTTGNTIAKRKLSDLKNRLELVNQTSNGILLSIHQNYFSDSKYSGAQMFFNQTEDGKLLAQLLQSEFRNSLSNNNRKAKAASGVYLMKYAEVPAVLIECGFLSNPEEESRLRDPEYQKKLCCIIASACSKYLHGSDSDLTYIK